MANVLNYGLEVNEFEFLSCYNIHFQTNTQLKSVNLLTLPARDYVLSLIGFGIKWPTKVDMPFNKENKLVLARETTDGFMPFFQENLQEMKSKQPSL